MNPFLNPDLLLIKMCVYSIAAIAAAAHREFVWSYVALLLVAINAFALFGLINLEIILAALVACAVGYKIATARTVKK